jgi:hypothetical protein
MTTGAEDAAQQALRQTMAVPSWSTLTGALELPAGLANDAESHHEAVRLFGPAHALRDTTCYQLCRTERDRDKAQAWEAFGDERSTVHLKKDGPFRSMRASLVLPAAEAIESARRRAGTA